MWKFKEHFQTIIHHKKLVMESCFKVGMYWQGLTHDLSKFSVCEFPVGAKYYQGDKSPNVAERRDKGYSSAWLHHKGRNKHHLEYWLDYDENVSKTLRGMKMPKRYVVEMFWDRVAANKTYKKENYVQSDPWDYYIKGKSKNILHSETALLLENLLKILRDEGEDAAVDYIKKRVLKKRDYFLIDRIIGNILRISGQFRTKKTKTEKFGKKIKKCLHL